VTVRVLDRAGDYVSGAVVTLEVLDTTYLAVDGTGLGLIGRVPTVTTARVVAVSGSLRSDPVAFRVLPAADTIRGPTTTALTVAAADSQSAPLTTTLADLTTTAGTSAPLGARPVLYTLVFPAYADIASARALLSNDSLAATVLTASGTGSAAVVVKRRGTPQPDSAVVLATAVRGSGATVPGSPVRFVVRFQ